MKKLITIVGVLSLSLATFAADRPVLVKGIVCIATEAVNGFKPLLMIKDISETNATLYLSMNDGLPDIRNSSVDPIVENGKLIVGYVSHDSEISPNAPNFSAYTNGSTPQDTTEANLTFENKDSKIKMTCKDGMGQ